MNDEQLASADAKRFAAQFSGFMKACEMLGELGSVKQASDEAQAQLTALKAEHEALAAQMELRKAALAELKATAAAEIEASKDSAEKHAANRVKEAERIVADGQARAADIISKAQAEASKIVDDANQAVASIKDRIGELSNSVNDKNGYLAELDKDIAKREVIFSAINEQIAQLKARL